MGPFPGWCPAWARTAPCVGPSPAATGALRASCSQTGCRQGCFAWWPWQSGLWLKAECTAPLCSAGCHAWSTQPPCVVGAVLILLGDGRSLGGLQSCPGCSDAGVHGCGFPLHKFFGTRAERKAGLTLVANHRAANKTFPFYFFMKMRKMEC